MEGKVKFYDSVKGFGFIVGEDEKEYFVHSSAIKQGSRLTDEAEVTFTPTEGDRGPKAEDVALKSESSDEEDSEDEDLDMAA